ncbi:MAG: RNHCP domain-containing protein [Sphaerochaetaceae bacterium]|nr:RNHCP domain-containing protein [Sphaerochaetaceae bacterium]
MSMTDTDDFICLHCGYPVSSRAWGTKHRNHCPNCLWSRHVDIKPGDRACLCRGEMEPIALWEGVDGELKVLHRCRTCGTIKANRVAGDDNFDALTRLIPRLSS